MGKSEGKRPLGRPRHRWEGNIKMDFQEVSYEAGTGSMRFRIGAGGGHFLMRYSFFWFHKIWGIS
jgi:hypothetical protein